MRRADTRRWVALLLFAVALVLAGSLGGWRGLAGVALGVTATGISLLGWAYPLRLLGDAAKATEEPQSRLGITFVVVIFLAKLPLFILLAFIARRMAGAAIPCFLGGLGLVYFLLIGWALTREERAT